MSLSDVQALLASGDPEQRRTGLSSLVDVPFAEAEPHVLSALGDADWRVRREAVELAVGNAPRESFTQTLIAILQTVEDTGLRNAAIEVIGRIGHGMSDALQEACADANAGSRKFLIEAMGKTQDPGMLESLAVWLDGEDQNIAAATMEAVARIGGQDAERMLRSQLHRSDNYLRITLLESLSKLGAHVPWGELAPALQDGPARRVAVELMGRSGSVEAIDPLWELAEDPSERSRASALRGIHELACSSEEAGRMITDRMLAASSTLRDSVGHALVHGDANTREAAAYLAASLKDASLVEAFVAAFADGLVGEETVPMLRGWGAPLIDELLALQGSDAKIWSTSLELASGLAEASAIADGDPLGERVRDAIRRALQDSGKRVLAAAASTLRAWGQPQDIDAVRSLLRDPAPSVRHCAGEALRGIAARHREEVDAILDEADLDGEGGFFVAETLGFLQTERSIELLRRGLQSKSAQTRRACVAAVDALPLEDTDAWISYAVLDENVDVQLAAVRALGHSNSVAARQALSSGLRSEFSAVRADAAIALGQLGATQCANQIESLLRDDEPVVAAAAIESLALLGADNAEHAIERGLAAPSEEIVQASLRAAARLNGDAAIERVARGLNHSAWHIRVLAATLLGDFRCHAAREVLEGARKVESDQMVLQAIVAGIENREGP